MFIPLSGATFPVAACSFWPSKNVRNTKPSIGIIYFPPNKHPKSQTVCRHSHNQWFGGCSDVITFGSHVLVLWRPSSEELDIEPRLNSPALCSCLHTMNNEHHITITASVYGEQSLSVILFFEVAKVWTGINRKLKPLSHCTNARSSSCCPSHRNVSRCFNFHVVYDISSIPGHQSLVPFTNSLYAIQVRLNCG